MRKDDRLSAAIARLEALRAADLAAIDRRFLDLETLRAAQRDGDLSGARAAAEDLERQLDTILQFGNRLSDQAGGFLSRDVYDTAHEALRVALDLVRSNLEALRTQHVQDTGDLRGQLASIRARTAGYTAGLVAVVTILTAVIAVIQITGK